MALYTEKQRQAVIARACEAVRARIRGKKSVVLGKGATRQEFDLDSGGWCLRFVRMCFETALGLPPKSWYFGSPKAVQTLHKLAPYQIPLSARRPGDILGNPGDPGHIVIYIGYAFDRDKDLVAENTISERRGYPQSQGTKVSSYSDFVKQHTATYCYRLFPKA